MTMLLDLVWLPHLGLSTEVHVDLLLKMLVHAYMGLRLYVPANKAM